MITTVVSKKAAIVTFSDILSAVNNVPNVSRGVRGNMRSAVERTADLVGAQGLSGLVCVQLIAKKLASLNAAKLGFRSSASFAAFKSNLHRALRLAGITVMPGASRVQLLPAWSTLREGLQTADAYLWIPVSRFAHFASEQGWDPSEIERGHFEQFCIAIKETCLSSKADKTIRSTARAWQRARELVPSWPSGDLGHAAKRQPSTLLPWSEFPPSFEQNAQQFVDRGHTDWLTTDTRSPLKPRTQSNYLAAIRRMGSTLVMTGAVTASDLTGLKDLVSGDRAETLLRVVHGRTKRKDGGLIGFFAVLLLMIGRDYVGLSGPALARLEKLQRNTLSRERRMSDRTLTRLTQFDNDVLLQRLLALPEHLMALADQCKPANHRAAKLARCSLYIALLLDLGCRSENVAELDLGSQIISEGTGRKRRGFVLITGSETKNGTEIRAGLRPLTTSMLCHYRDLYRPFHCASTTSWLFPRTDGSHWTVVQACADLKDLIAKHVGADVTPHLFRALAGKIVLDENPGSFAIVQQLLGHKSIQTTTAFYIRLEPARARAQYHDVLTTTQRRGRTR